MRHLASTQYLVETGTNEYKTTNFTKAMAHELMGDSHIAMLVLIITTHTTYKEC